VSAAVPSAREAILAAIRQARPPVVARPEAYTVAPLEAGRSGASRIDTFVDAAIAAGARVTACAPDDVDRVLAGALAGARSVLSFADGVPSHHAPSGDLHDLAALDAFVCEPELGVAENGAVWIASSSERLRAALFLAARVVMVVKEADLVDDLHAAYARIDVRAHPFGAFVAGPSKTADIEQSLVIGAHGPKALSIVVVRA